MARLYDNQGVLLGGLKAITRTVRPKTRRSARPAVTTCSYGAAEFAYRVRPLDLQMARYQPRTRLCRTPLTARQRFHCAACGGDYCAAHAAPEAHDCALLIPRP